MRNIFLLPALLLIWGCSLYSLVQPGLIDVKGIEVTPAIPWNATPRGSSIGGKPTWTADGIWLNSLTFISDIKDGKTLFQSTEKQQYPTFTADMLPNEIVELVESSVAKQLSATVSSRETLKPLMVDGNPGFEAEFSVVTDDEVPRKIYVAGAVKNDALYLILFQATRMHYYDKYIGEVTNMAKGMVLN